MTSLVATEPITVVDKSNSFTKFNTNCYKSRQHRHVLKSKENTYKQRCNKVLRRKLKKYKLRLDGREDEDVIDLSKTLVSSLIIKSPTNLKYSIISEGDSNDLEELRPKNYLFKMVRRKEAIKISDTLKNSNTELNIQDVTNSIPLAISSQEKKQTNAFQLLMDSRNKSIGSNSPGKEISNDNSDSEEILERKNVKAKRHLLLQKMAEAKGSIKNKEKEEYQDKIIQRQMEKRAERLKTMILKDTKPKNENNRSQDASLERDDALKFEVKDKEVINIKNTKKKANTLKIVDIFNTLEEPINISPVKKHIPKEDQDFLKKLSPSLKKKESMLCYFKKVDKDIELSPTNSENDNLIKVKLQPRNKKKGKKKKLSLKRETVGCELTENNINYNKDSKVMEEHDTVIAVIENKQQIKRDDHLANVNVHETALADNQTVASHNGYILVKDAEEINERKKRKRTTKVDAENTVLTNDSRPKRSVKRPVKYIDDAGLSSSDEELHIFTPKKKKHIENTDNDKKSVSLKSNQSVDEPVKLKSERKEEKALKEIGTLKKPTKLAPIFAPKQSTDPAALEAKQKFLQSGVPDKLKRVIQLQRNNSIPDNSFPVLVHVQQCNKTHEDNKLLMNIPLVEVTEEICPIICEKDAFKNLLHLNEPQFSYNIDNINKKCTQTMLQNIKKTHPKFPVYRTYRYLRGKGKGEFRDCNYVDVDNSIEIMNDMVDVISDSPDRLNWTDKYKAMSTNQIIGNFESIKELKKWLISWTENEVKTKNRAESDSSDYYQSDTDSRDSMKTMNNLLILTGPTGSGKTASVYAVASELAMKVIEVNASSRRTGKIMLQDLQEATQSHKVNRGTGNIDSSQKSQEKCLPDILKKKKRGRPKKSLDDEQTKKQSAKSEVLNNTPLSQESTRTDSSLILIDDADIVFDQDDGFSSAIVQLVHCSKRPVILITSTLVCPHLQRFLQNGKILKMCPLLPRMLGTWLDIMCLADSGVCWPGVGAKFLNYFKGDIRKTINYLQFCIPSYIHTSANETASQKIDYKASSIDEENSCTSWADDDSEGRTIALGVNDNNTMETNTIWTDFADRHLNLNSNPVQLFNIWWSMPYLLATANNNIIEDCKENDSKGQCKKKVYLELEAMANAVDALSLTDYMSHINPDSNMNITSTPWYSAEGNSVSERENYDYYSKEYLITNEISQTIVTGSVAAAQDVFGCIRKMDLDCPGMTLHRERDRVISRHKSLVGYLNIPAVLDRKALALDYWSSCRTICRFEKSKNDTSTKRNNRFCHYLKSLSVLCKSDTFDNLCDSLCSNEGTELNINNINE